MKNLFNNKKLLISQICFLVLSLSLSSCNNDESTPALPTFGYFEGMINNKYIKLEEKSQNDMILFNDYSVSNEDSVASYGVAINIPKENTGDKKMSIYIYLSPLSRQLYEIGPTYDIDLPFTRIELHTDSDTEYKPNKTPFKINIDTIVSHKDDPKIMSRSPRISGRMEGVMYNTQSPQDSIIFKNVKFRVWNSHL